MSDQKTNPEQKMTIEAVIYGCWLGGCSLEQYLATIDGYGPSHPKLQEETRLIVEHLKRPQAERDAVFRKALQIA